MLNAPIISLDTIDSTNNYAMRLIDADTAQPGLTIVAAEQTAGKGQRGRKWEDVPAQSLLMTIIAVPDMPLTDMFTFNALVAVSIADVLQNLCENVHIAIKWPNDIIINDKKAVGVLVENVLRGQNWTYSIIGFGVNVLQEEMPAGLPYATSLRIVTGKLFSLEMLMEQFRTHILRELVAKHPPGTVMERYNELLYRRGALQRFTSGAEEWEGYVGEAGADGLLQIVDKDGTERRFRHGELQWVW